MNWAARNNEGRCHFITLVQNSDIARFYGICIFAVLAVMADDRSLISAIHKRHEQLKRWEESDTNKCVNHTLNKDKKVKFQDGCIFLAACSSGDHEEVKRLLDRGADINTANIDGLTALHQVFTIYGPSNICSVCTQKFHGITI